MRTFVLSLAAAAALVVAGTAATHAAPIRTAVTVAVADASPDPVPAPVTTVHIKNMAFVPDTVTINAGETVRFVEDEEIAHTVTASDKSFDSGNLDQKSTWSHTFAKAGTYAYICTYHPFMKGKIVVK